MLPESGPAGSAPFKGITTYRVGEGEVGRRLDVVLTERARAEYPAAVSRAWLQRAISEGRVLLNGRPSKASARVKHGDRIEIAWPARREARLEPEPLPLEVLYEDEDCLVVDKRPGWVVHPGAGHARGTLVHALLHHRPELQRIAGEGRPGIIHRLDKDTSGVMVVAKTPEAFNKLAGQFKQGSVEKEYLCVVWGKPRRPSGVIDRPIGRHRWDRKRMSSRFAAGRRRSAVTLWECVETFPLGPSAAWCSLLRVRPLTGRTHQIRVHLSEEGHPLVGDRVYGRKRRWAAETGLWRLLGDFPRQALHALRLAFEHPRSGARVEFRAPLPDDMERLLAELRRTVGEKGSGGGVDNQDGFP